MSARDNSASVGISMGSALAMILSYDRNHSILYAVVHGLCTGFTFSIGYSGDNTKRRPGNPAAAAPAVNI
jgi:hypothetical protein